MAQTCGRTVQPPLPQHATSPDVKPGLWIPALPPGDHRQEETERGRGDGAGAEGAKEVWRQLG